ncbi:hypothetical protein [Lysobacter sp. yr284]|uniref:hypothetical protein n=1 Tax=Lysobacter sp. yr284 TaxID=1761791 RepID=UPI001587C3F0|nr:hypothetical protein [Lysobacter sp. yr284]
MRLEDFDLGTVFFSTTGQRWRCTDVGRRTILAIELGEDLHEDWTVGPPYVIPEVPFDEIGIAAAYRSAEESIRDALEGANRDSHPGYSTQAVWTMMEARLSEESSRYPRSLLFRIDRVDANGEIFHPFAANRTGDMWSIQVYLPFTQQYEWVPESDFIRMRAATEVDLQIRAGRA